MVGLVEGMVYAHKAGLDVESYLNAISTEAAGSKSLDLFGHRILKRAFAPGFYVDHFVKDLGICLNEYQNMGIALPGLALAQQLHVSLKAHGEDHSNSYNCYEDMKGKFGQEGGRFWSRSQMHISGFYLGSNFIIKAHFYFISVLG